MYNGFLVKIGNYDFPMKYINAESYDIAPDQRQDEEPWRDGDGVLNREVLNNMPASITFTTIPGMTNTEVAAVFGQIRQNYIDEKERKVLVTFYNPETDSYPEAKYMYIPNPHFPIDYIDENTVYYKEIIIELVGY